MARAVMVSLNACWAFVPLEDGWANWATFMPCMPWQATCMAAAAACWKLAMACIVAPGCMAGTGGYTPFCAVVGAGAVSLEDWVSEVIGCCEATGAVVGAVDGVAMGAGAAKGAGAAVVFVVVMLLLLLLSMTETWAWACMSNLVKSSFWCFRAPLALEKKMTLLWRSSIMTFLRRLDSRAALRFCSSLVSRAFLLAADAVGPFE
mmetsp:Transcript_406/g.882  ORF Transcript_406/g.882 Transcript_406/m.882 type:complete len:205 (+) Transcript_406:295-909(+)